MVTDEEADDTVKRMEEKKEALGVVGRSMVPDQKIFADEKQNSPKRVGGQLLFYNRKQRTLSLLDQLDHK